MERNKSTSRRIRDPRGAALTALKYLVLIIGAVVMMFPFIWMLLTSLKTLPEAISIPPQWLPSALRWENWSYSYAQGAAGHVVLDNQDLRGNHHGEHEEVEAEIPPREGVDGKGVGPQNGEGQGQDHAEKAHPDGIAEVQGEGDQVPGIAPVFPAERRREPLGRDGNGLRQGSTIRARSTTPRRRPSCSCWSSC